MQLINREFIISWNNLYPLDRWWRKKYNIPFNSPKHRAVSYIDIYYEWLEDHMFEEFIEREGEELKKLDHYQKTGQWLFDQTNTEERKSKEEQKLIDLFEKADIGDFDNIDDNE